MKRQLRYVDTTELQFQLKSMTLVQLSYVVDTFLGLFDDTSDISLSGDWDGIAWLTISFSMTEDEWKHSGLVNRLYALEKEYIAAKKIRHYERIIGPSDHAYDNAKEHHEQTT